MPAGCAKLQQRSDAPVELFDVGRHAFLFDVDGTLLDIAAAPQAVQVPASLRQHLDRLGARADGATALVSGRALAELDRLFAPLKLTMIGGHGNESRVWRNGRAEQHTSPPIDIALRRQFEDIRSIDPGLLTEDKGYSFTVHYRQAPDKAAAVREAIEGLRAKIDAQDLEIMNGKAVFEIKRAGINKGTAIRALMAKAPFNGRRPIYIGDDVTDEDAFAVMPEFDGVAISVGRRVDGVARCFDDTAAVRRWLAALG